MFHLHNNFHDSHGLSLSRRNSHKNTKTQKKILWNCLDRKEKLHHSVSFFNFACLNGFSELTKASQKFFVTFFFVFRSKVNKTRKLMNSHLFVAVKKTIWQLEYKFYYSYIRITYVDPSRHATKRCHQNWC